MNLVQAAAAVDVGQFGTDGAEVITDTAVSTETTDQFVMAVEVGVFNVVLEIPVAGPAVAGTCGDVEAGALQGGVAHIANHGNVGLGHLIGFLRGRNAEGSALALKLGGAGGGGSHRRGGQEGRTCSGETNTAQGGKAIANGHLKWVLTPLSV